MQPQLTRHVLAKDSALRRRAKRRRPQSLAARDGIYSQLNSKLTTLKWNSAYESRFPALANQSRIWLPKWDIGIGDMDHRSERKLLCRPRFREKHRNARFGARSCWLEERLPNNA